jgi:hypothetical protein
MARLPGQLPSWLTASRLARSAYVFGILFCLPPYVAAAATRALEARADDHGDATGVWLGLVGATLVLVATTILLARRAAAISIVGSAATFAVTRAAIALYEHDLSASYIETTSGWTRHPVEAEIIAALFFGAAFGAVVGAPLVGPALWSRRTRATLAATAGHALFVAGACLLGPAAIAVALTAHAAASVPSIDSWFVAGFSFGPPLVAGAVALVGGVLSWRRDRWLGAIVSGLDPRHRIRPSDDADEHLPCLGPGHLAPAGVLEEVLFVPEADPYRAPPSFVRALARIVTDEVR